MIMDWYRSGNEVVSRKKAERKGFNNTFTFPLISRMNTDNKDNKEDQCKSVKSVGITRKMHVLLRMYGLRPYVEWQSCTFDGTDIASRQSHLEATATPRSLNTEKTSLKVNFLLFFLCLCIFFCTFAAEIIYHS